MEKEIWKTIEGYENYQVSNWGNVKSLGNNKKKKEKILKPANNGLGYLYVLLYKNKERKKFTTHRLVATTFIPNKENKPCINHKNEIKTDNRVENLEWVTIKENNNYGTRNERVSKSLQGRKQTQEHIEKSSKSRSIPIVQMDLQGNFIAIHQGARQVQRELGFNCGHINECCKGKLKTYKGFKWKYLSEYKKAV